MEDGLRRASACGGWAAGGGGAGGMAEGGSSPLGLLLDLQPDKHIAVAVNGAEDFAHGLPHFVVGEVL
jgi:hypothetical protein